MNEQKNNGRGIFYGVIGIATLVVAIVGATFAYFTATAGENDVIKGNMATVSLGLSASKVTFVDETKRGMIPMSNGMVQAAVSKSADKADEICLDDNGNAVCQIYKITVTNTSAAGQFVDGYVALTGGSGVPTDISKIIVDPTTDIDEDGICDEDGDNNKTEGAESNYTEEGCEYLSYNNATTATTMRWAQVFCTDKADGTNKVTGCSTNGTQFLNDINLSGVAINAIGNTNDGHNISNIKYTYDSVVTAKGATGATEIAGNKYDTITSNYVRISDHLDDDTFDRTEDITSALVYNQRISGNSTGEAINNVAVNYYIVVWLSETGTDQTAGSGGENVPAANATDNFFTGKVRFISAQGSEVSATISGYTRVPATYAPVAQG